MRATAAMARVLARLLADGNVPASSLSDRVRAELAGLFDAGVLGEERRGGGRRIVVADHRALQDVCGRWFPSGVETLLGEAGAPRSRIEAVASRRDAKAAPRSATEPVLVRGFGDAVLTRGRERLAVGKWTSAAGFAALELDPVAPWGFAGEVVVVENLEPFRRLEEIAPDVGLAVYAAGRLSARLLAWLAGEAMLGCRLRHWGDYDPVGVDEFLKLKARCGGRVEMVVPDGLDGLFERFGKAALLRDSEAVLRRVRQATDPTARFVVGLMDRHGCGLEQEALLGGRC